MGIAGYEGLTQKQTIFRLALALDIEYNCLLKMPLWQVRERAFFSGEQVVVGRLQNIQNHFNAMNMHRSEKADKYFEDIRNELQDDVMVERQLNIDERRKRVIEHNKRAMKNMFGSPPNLSQGEKSKKGGK